MAKFAMGVMGVLAAAALVCAPAVMPDGTDSVVTLKGTPKTQPKRLGIPDGAYFFHKDNGDGTTQNVTCGVKDGMFDYATSTTEHPAHADALLHHSKTTATGRHGYNGEDGDGNWKLNSNLQMIISKGSGIGTPLVDFTYADGQDALPFDNTATGVMYPRVVQGTNCASYFKAMANKTTLPVGVKLQSVSEPRHAEFTKVTNQALEAAFTDVMTGLAPTPAVPKQVNGIGDPAMDMLPR